LLKIMDDNAHNNLTAEAAGCSWSGELRCCVPGTARILKGALSLPYILKLIKSQTQPDGGGSKRSEEASPKGESD
jgi:hypothetical protein